MLLIMTVVIYSGCAFEAEVSASSSAKIVTVSDYTYDGYYDYEITLEYGQTYDYTAYYSYDAEVLFQVELPLDATFQYSRVVDWTNSSEYSDCFNVTIVVKTDQDYGYEYEIMTCKDQIVIFEIIQGSYILKSYQISVEY